MSGGVAMIASENIGQTTDGEHVDERRNTDGSTYFCAWTRITHLFGHKLAGDGALLEGFGTTEAQARNRLKTEEHKFNDRLWS